MEGFEKTLVANVDILFFIALVEAVIIVLLVSYLLYRIWEDGAEGSSKSPDNEVKYKQEIKQWKEQCIEQNRELQSLRKEKKSWQNSHGSQTTSEHTNRWNSKPSYESNLSKNISSDLAEYVKKEQEKGIYVKETPNGDGTLKSEVLFESTDQEPASVPISALRKYEYLEAANGGQFRKLLPSEEKCFFRTWEENGVRKFEFHGNVENALANINAIFDDVCEIEGKQNGATQIINVDPGILDSKLKVETPAKIKLA